MTAMIASGDLARGGWVFHRRADAPPMQRVQVMGERASGTNFLRVLLEDHVALKQTGEYGWKHGFPAFPVQRVEDLLVVCFRAPEPWLLSLYHKPWHVRQEQRDVSFAAFLRQPFDTVRDMHLCPGEAKGPGAEGMPIQQDRDPQTGRVFANPVLLRNAKTRGFLTLPAREVNCCLLRYEAVLADPARFVAELSAFYDVEFEPQITLPAERLGGMGRAQTGARRDAKPAFSPADRAFLAEQIDRGQEAQLGYKVSEDTSVKP